MGRLYNDGDTRLRAEQAVFDSLFGRKKRRPKSAAQDETLSSAGVGDVFTIAGYSLDYEDTYFLIEKRNRYASASGEWHELLGAEGDKKLWLEWAGDKPQTVSARSEERPVGLQQAGFSEQDLVRMDEEHSLDNTVTYEGATYQYENSGEVFYFEDRSGDGAGFYLWEFVSEEPAKIVSVVKWEGSPFEVYASDVLPIDSVSLYRG